MEGQPEHALPADSAVTVVVAAAEAKPRPPAVRRDIGKKRLEVCNCMLAIVMVFSFLFAVVGGSVSSVYCTPCRDCENGVCAFFRTTDGNTTDGGATSCKLNVVFNDALMPQLNRSTLTIEPNCTSAFSRFPADGVTVPCFTKSSRLYVNSTTDLDSYAEQCPGMVAGLLIACVMFVATTIAGCCVDWMMFEPVG